MKHIVYLAGPFTDCRYNGFRVESEDDALHIVRTILWSN